ncbi:MAG: hypothetical protein ACXWQR_04260 [Ktedonobacterales bacterium]
MKRGVHQTDGPGPTPARYVSSTEMAQSMWGIQESEATAEYKSILRDVFGERSDRR